MTLPPNLKLTRSGETGLTQILPYRWCLGLADIEVFFAPSLVLGIDEKAGHLEHLLLSVRSWNVAFLRGRLKISGLFTWHLARPREGTPTRNPQKLQAVSHLASRVTWSFQNVLFL